MKKETIKKRLGAKCVDKIRQHTSYCPNGWIKKAIILSVRAGRLGEVVIAQILTTPLRLSHFLSFCMFVMRLGMMPPVVVSLVTLSK